MKYEVIIKPVCNGAINCMSTADWIQIISVTIAMLAAIASYMVVYLTKKQFKEESEDRKKIQTLF